MPPTPNPPGPRIGVRTTDWSGRFSLSVTEPGTDERTETTQGRFTIHRSSDDALEVEFGSPFGQTLGRMTIAANGVAALTLSDGRRFDGASADTLVAELLGWQIPVGRLVGWLDGRDSGGPDAWRVDVERRFDDGRPRLLRALWPARQRVDERRLGLRVFVDSLAP